MEPLGKTFRTRAEDEALAGGSTDMGVRASPPLGNQFFSFVCFC